MVVGLLVCVVDDYGNNMVHCNLTFSGFIVCGEVIIVRELERMVFKET